MGYEERNFEKECLKDNAGGGQEVCGQEGPKQNTPIGCFVKRIYCEIARLQDSAGVVCSVTDRLTGVEAEKDLDDAAKRAEPDCEFDKLSNALQDLARAIDLMGYQANRLVDKT